MAFPIISSEDCWKEIDSRMVDPIIEEQQIHSGAINCTSEPTLIDDIDKNGYIVYEKEKIVQAGEINDESQYFVDIIKYRSHEDDETESNNVLNQSFDCYIIGKKFDDVDAAYNFYNECGLSKGFVIRKHYHKKH